MSCDTLSVGTKCSRRAESSTVQQGSVFNMFVHKSVIKTEESTLQSVAGSWAGLCRSDTGFRNVLMSAGFQLFY